MERRQARASERRRTPGLALAAAIAAVSGGLLALAAAIAAGAPIVAALTLALGAIGVGLAAGALLLVRRLQVSGEKAQSDIDFIARRLLRVESRLAEAERRKGGAPDPELRGAVAEVSGEIALISGLLRDLAGTVAQHDRQLAELEEPPEPAMPAAPYPVPPQQPAHQAPRAAPPRPAPPEREPDPVPEPAAPPPQLRPRFTPVLGPEPAPPQPRHAPFEPAPFDDEPAEAADLDPLFDEPPPVVVDPQAERRMQAFVRALREDRIEIHLQPIVNLPQRKTRFYEALPRLRLSDEELVLPEEFLPGLERAGALAELDGKVAARAAAIARHLVVRGSDAFVTCNLSHPSLTTPGFLVALGRILEAYPDVAGRVGFEIAQRSWRMLDAPLAAALDGLRAKGAPFLLDRAGDLRLDPYGLADRGVRFVKIPSALLLAQLQPGAQGLDIAVGDLAGALARAGIRLVADAVDREEDVPDLIDLDVPLAQGLVLGAPRAVRSDLIGGPPGRGGGGGAEPPARPTPGASAVAAQANAGSRPGIGPTAHAGASSPKATSRTPSPGPEPDRPEPRLPYRATLRRAG